MSFLRAVMQGGGEGTLTGPKPVKLRALFKLAFGPKTDECIKWPFAREENGYGRLEHRGKRYSVHRLVMMLLGEDVSGKFVCHHCDNPPCINPEHLFVGKPVDNTQDMIRKGRKASTKGILNGQAKLTRKLAKEIREYEIKGQTFKELGYLVGVSAQTICDVRLGRKWL